MEEMTIVFFAHRAGAAKRKRRGEWQYYIQKEKTETPGGMLHLVYLQIPQFWYKNKVWKETALEEYVRGFGILPEGRNVLYLFDKQMQKFLAREDETLSEEWIYFLLKYYRPEFDNLIILADRELEPEPIIWQYARKTRYVGIVSKETGAFLDLQEALSEEYGFLLDLAEEFKQLHPLRDKRTVIVARDSPEGLSPAQLNEESLWLSAKPDEAAKRLCRRAKSVRYLDIEIFFKDVMEKMQIKQV